MECDLGRMTVHCPIVLETEANGAVSAYVPGLPVYAAADSHTKAERAIRAVLTAYLEAHPDSRSKAQLRVARFSDRQEKKIDIVGVAALVGARRSATKARACERPAWRTTPESGRAGYEDPLLNEEHVLRDAPSRDPAVAGYRQSPSGRSTIRA